MDTVDIMDIIDIRTFFVHNVHDVHSVHDVLFYSFSVYYTTVIQHVIKVAKSKRPITQWLRSGIGWFFRGGKK